MPDDLSKDDDGNWVPEDPEFVKEPSRDNCGHEWSTYWVDGVEYPMCRLCGRIEGTMGVWKDITHDDDGEPLWEDKRKPEPWWRRAWKAAFR